MKFSRLEREGSREIQKRGGERRRKMGFRVVLREGTGT